MPKRVLAALAVRPAGRRLNEPQRTPSGPTLNAPVQPKLSLEAYLAWEEQQPERHEFYRGEVFPMVWTRRAHGRVVNNLSGELGLALKSTP